MPLALAQPSWCRMRRRTTKDEPRKSELRATTQERQCCGALRALSAFLALMLRPQGRSLFRSTCYLYPFARLDVFKLSLIALSACVNAFEISPPL